MLVASAIMLTVTAAVFQLMNPARGTFKAQPEISDMQQRLRVAIETLRGDLVMAGAGSYMGSGAGSLYNFFAPVMPYRTGALNDDPSAGVFYRTDTVSLLYVPTTAAQTHVVKTIGNNSQEIAVEREPNCPDGSKNNLCGFEDGMRVLIMDPNGTWETTTLTQIQDTALHLQHDGKLLNDYGSTAMLTQVKTVTYYLKQDDSTQTYQLRYYDGYQTDLPVADDVVKLDFKYFGDPQPPRLVPNKALSDVNGPWTTYGPKPPALASPGTGTWPIGENCAFYKDGAGLHQPRLPVLGDGISQVELTKAMLTDGPWCPDDTSPVRFDADLLRVRRIRAVVRVQAALSSLRGPAGVLFTHGGTSTSSDRYVPDQELSFDIAPRNLNLGR
jgi:hypothetical protein